MSVIHPSRPPFALLVPARPPLNYCRLLRRGLDAHGEAVPLGQEQPVSTRYRSRAWDTRVGTMELHIPKLREGSYFPSLLEPRRRSERALLAVIQQAYVEGVSTRRVDDLVKALGCEGISKSQVSRICQELDVVVDGFLGRPLTVDPTLTCGWTH